MKRIIPSIIALAFSTAPLVGQDIPLSKILVDKEGWREVAKGLPGILHLGGVADGSITVNQTGGAGILTAKGEFLPGPDIFLRRDARRALSAKGRDYIIEGANTVETFEAGLPVHTLKLPGLKSATCLTLWPDEGHLVIGEADGAYLWAVRIEKDGSLGRGDRYYSLRTKPNEKMHVTAMTMDAGYLLYACTPLGIQVFDPTGRLSGVIAAPSKETMTAITIGGEKAATLFVAAGDKIYARKIQGKAPYTLKKGK